ncbi:MAG: hypothetical protein GY744_04810 [Gammaproteobacteria bacterium]|nr:hypothetical protein [Gammaproteobacteria bacterium]
MKKLATISALCCVLMSTTIFSLSVAADYPIAGTKPSQRPEGAPTIEWVQKRDRSWYQKGLTGVTPPYPRSLYFMDNQGNWYTPFINPGMTGPYDLRGWHK